MSLSPGTRLGDYEITRPLGAGGMGEVYLARDLTLDRQVAIKILPTDVTSDPQRVARLEREARSASALSHPNVCVIHALGSTSDGRRFIAMEYVEGQTLRERLSRQRAAPALREALDIAIQLAAGIGAAHALGIVHRDLKPENVIVRADALVKVLDFGLAKLTLSDSLAATVDDPTRAHLSTMPGIVVGTAAYMSPEQVRGLEIDARTDIWSLGVILYELVTGRRPFAGTSGSDVMVGILDREPDPLTRFDPRLPAELQRIVGKALRKDREQRYQVIKDLRLDLEALRDDLQLQSRQGTSTAVPPPPASLPTESVERHQSSAEYLVGQIARHKGAVALTLAVLAIVTALAVWWAVGRTRSDTVPQPAAGPVQRTLTRLTFGAGLQTDPTFSPDGRFIAYASDRSGNFDIWVQPVAGGEPVQVTRSPAHDTQPAWAPDGATLVFRSERDGGGLFVVPALGGVERQLTSFGTHPSWSAGSSHILFFRGIGPGEGSWPTRVFEVSPSEGAPRELLPDFFGRGDWFWIGRHPDGRLSMWGQHRQLGPGFFTVAPDGKHVVTSKETDGLPVRIHGGGSIVRRRFHWHPSGSILFIQTQAGGVYNLWRVRVDPASLAWMSAERLTTGAGTDVSPAMSGDGTRLAFVTERQTSRMTAYPLHARGQRLGAGRPLTEEDAAAELATISPDGRRLAYNLRRPGARGVELRLVSMDGGPSELLANDAIGPIWSRDGTSLVYNYFDLGKNPIAARVALRQLGGHERFLSNWRNDFLFGTTYWTSDGLLGTRGPSSLTGDASLVLWSLDHLNAPEPDRVIASIPDAVLFQATLSPNGRWVSFFVNHPKQPGTSELMIAPAQGSPPDRFTRVAADHAWPDKPRWARDGKRLYFISRRPGPHFNLWAVAFDPDRGVPVGKPFQLTAFDSPTLHISSDLARAEMDVSATDVVLTMRSVSGSVWMLDGVDR
jgi:serine/threonine protein kinase/Tol biopolymer transport system component